MQSFWSETPAREGEYFESRINTDILEAWMMPKIIL